MIRKVNQREKERGKGGEKEREGGREEGRERKKGRERKGERENARRVRHLTSSGNYCRLTKDARQISASTCVRTYNCICTRDMIIYTYARRASRRKIFSPYFVLSFFLPTAALRSEGERMKQSPLPLPSTSTSMSTSLSSRHYVRVHTSRKGPQ